MSYSLVVYLVDQNQISRVVNSKDSDLFNELKEHFLDEHDEDEWEEEDFNVKTGLEHLVSGAPISEEDRHMVGYGLEYLCQFVGGETMDTDRFASVHYDFLEKVKYVLPLVNRGAPIPTISLGDDFPYIGYLTRDECKKLSVETEELEHPDQGILLAQNDFFKWVDAAASENKDLIGFYY
ncbi:hypothetical protein Pan241w_60420 [Gimesia alba]|uniref:DUF7691 domain-containing protein n=1 Tax=Gimesia alba TaxID=2527973 RepID=A0A517RPX1_9PLAN|nr:hypothetical protein [Gimesia alba]QDT45914.1 hypothetical protein Pan241w_60420 [Gimesia alba]